MFYDWIRLHVDSVTTSVPSLQLGAWMELCKGHYHVCGFLDGECGRRMNGWCIYHQRQRLCAADGTSWLRNDTLLSDCVRPIDGPNGDVTIRGLGEFQEVGRRAMRLDRKLPTHPVVGVNRVAAELVIIRLQMM